MVILNGNQWKMMFYATIMVKLHYLPAGANCAMLISHRLTPSFIHPFQIFNLDLSPFFVNLKKHILLFDFKQTVCECLLNLTLQRLRKYILYSFLTQNYNHRSQIKYFKLIFIKRKYKEGSHISLRKKVK